MLAFSAGAAIFSPLLWAGHSVDRASMRVTLRILPVAIVSVRVLSEDELKQSWPGLMQDAQATSAADFDGKRSAIRYRVHSPL